MLSLLSVTDRGGVVLSFQQSLPNIIQYMKHSDYKQSIRRATREHVPAITRIYKLVQIKPELLLRTASLARQDPAALKAISARGGFISPPDKKDMQLFLQNGLALVFLQGGQVVGYNRFLIRADKVFQTLCAEFQIDQSQREFSLDSFENWSGGKKLSANKTLKHIHWIDKSRALIAFRAGLKGLESRNTGRLAWSIDGAVHPQKQDLGISRALINRLNTELCPKFKYRAFRLFEICKINDSSIVIANDSSKRAFVCNRSTLFARTEEEIVVNDDVTLRVRWNHWLKQF